MNVLSLFFYFLLTLLSHIAGHASAPSTSSSELSLDSVATSFRSTPRTEADDFDAVLSPTEAIPGDAEEKTMKGTVSVYDLLVSALGDEESDEDEDEAVLSVLSPLNAAKKDSIISADDEGVHRKFLKKSFNKFTILTAENGAEAIDKARDFAEKRIPVKLFLFDFRMGAPDGGETALRVRDLEIKGENPYQNSVFLCLTGTPQDAAPYMIIDIKAWLAGKLRGSRQVFHQVRGKIDTPGKAQEVIVFVNDLLDQLASSQLGLLDLAAK